VELKKLENEVLKLSIEDRGALVEKLILSVDAPSETENLRLWMAEAEIAVECSVLDIRFSFDVGRSMFDVHPSMLTILSLLKNENRQEKN
jgi:hypothetical protein